MLSMRTVRGTAICATALMAAAVITTTAKADNSTAWPAGWNIETNTSTTRLSTTAPARAAMLPASSASVAATHTVSVSEGIAPGQIIASFADRRLYYVASRGTAISYPIATPRPQSRWQGVLKISRKQVNPRWTPTANMCAENPRLPASVPGGHPKNPLGNRALYLGSSLYRIHGTDAPWTIGKAVSKGCIRMLNKDVSDLYKRVGIGTKVTVTYRSLKHG